MKDKRINVRIAQTDKNALSEVSRKLDIPEAIIVREAVKEKIANLVKTINEEEKSLALQS